MPSFLPRRRSRQQPLNSVETQSHSPPTGTIVASSSSSSSPIIPSSVSASTSTMRLVSGVESEMNSGMVVGRGSMSTPDLGIVAQNSASNGFGVLRQPATGTIGSTDSKQGHVRQTSTGGGYISKIAGPRTMRNSSEGSVIGNDSGNTISRSNTTSSRVGGSEGIPKLLPSTPIRPSGTKSSLIASPSTTSSPIMAPNAPSPTRSISATPSPSPQKQTAKSRIAKLTRRISSSASKSPSGSIGSLPPPSSPSIKSSSIKKGEDDASESRARAGSINSGGDGSGSWIGRLAQSGPSKDPISRSPTVTKLSSSTSTSTSMIPKPSPSYSSPTENSPKTDERSKASPAIEQSSPVAGPNTKRTSGIPPPQYVTKLADRTSTFPVARSIPLSASSPSVGARSIPSPSRISNASTKTPTATRLQSKSLSPIGPLPPSSSPTSPTITRNTSSAVTPPLPLIPSSASSTTTRSQSNHPQFNPAPPLAAGRLSPAMTSRETFAGFGDLPPTPWEESLEDEFVLGERGGRGGGESGGGTRADLMTGLGVMIGRKVEKGKDVDHAGRDKAVGVEGGTAKHGAAPTLDAPQEDSKETFTGDRAVETIDAYEENTAQEQQRSKEEIDSTEFGKKVPSGAWLSGLSLGGGGGTSGNESSAEVDDRKGEEGIENGKEAEKPGSPLIKARPTSITDTSSSHRSDRFPSIINTPTKPSASAPTASLVTATARDVVTGSPLAPALGAFEGMSVSKRISQIPVPHLSPTTKDKETSPRALTQDQKSSDGPRLLSATPDTRTTPPSKIARKNFETKPTTPSGIPLPRASNVTRQEVTRAMSPGGEDSPIENDQDPRSVVSTDILASPAVRPGIQDTLAPVKKVSKEEPQTSSAEPATPMMSPTDLASVRDEQPETNPAEPAYTSQASSPDSLPQEKKAAPKPSFIRKPTAYGNFISQTSPGPPVAGRMPFWAGKQSTTDSQVDDGSRDTPITDHNKEKLTPSPPKGPKLHEVVDASVQVITPAIGRTPTPPLTPPQTTRRSSFVRSAEIDSPSPAPKSPRSSFPFSGVFAAPDLTKAKDFEDLAFGAALVAEEKEAKKLSSEGIEPGNTAWTEEQVPKEQEAEKLSSKGIKVEDAAPRGEVVKPAGATKMSSEDDKDDVKISAAVSEPSEEDASAPTWKESTTPAEPAEESPPPQHIQKAPPPDSASTSVSLETAEIAEKTAIKNPSSSEASSVNAVTVYTTPFCLPDISVAPSRQTQPSSETGIIASLLRPRVAVDLTWKGALLPSEIAINGDRSEDAGKSEERRKRSSLMIPLDVGVAAARIPFSVGRAAARAPVDISYAAASYAYSLVPGWKVAA